MKAAWEISPDPTYSPRSLIRSGITGLSTVMLAITGYIVYITYLRPRFFYDVQPMFRDLIVFFIAGLIAFGFGVFLTYLLRKLLTEYIPSWIFSSFAGSAILILPTYLFVYGEMSVFHEVDGGGVEHPQNWRVFLTSLLISLILFCIISIFSAAANYFSMRRNLVMGLK